MEAIKDISAYKSEIAKSMADKLFFLDKTDDSNVFVDYGCADGTLIRRSF